MTHPTMALAARSLRLDARSPFVHMLRGILGGLMLLALVYVYTTRAKFGAPGLNLYTAVITIDFFFVSVLGVALFATSITEERQEGSLGLMRMAGLNPIGILIGKSVSQLTVALSLLAVQLPFTMFAVTLGGVATHQILTGFATLGCYTLFCYGAGLLMSTVCRSGAAAGRATLAVLVIGSAWPFAWQLVRPVFVFFGSVSGKGSSAALTSLTIWGSLDQTTTTAFAGQEFEFGAAASLALIAAVLMFLAAWMLFDVLETRAGKERHKRGWFFDAWGGESRVPRFSGNALVWKNYRLFVGGRRGMFLRVGAYAIATVTIAWIHNPFGDAFERHNFGGVVLAVVGAGLVLDLGSLAGRVFRDEIAWQTYSTLLLLPKSVLQISYGKVMGCLWAVFPALIFLVLGMLCASGEVLLMLGPIVFLFISLLYILLPMIVYASLWLQRGAFPLTLFSFVLLLVGVLLAGEQASSFLCCCGGVLLIFAWRVGRKLHSKILDKLRELSGCDI